MHEFLTLGAHIVFTTTVVGLLIAGVAHCAVATDPPRRRDDRRRSTGSARPVGPAEGSGTE